MSAIKDLANLSNTLTVELEDQYGDQHTMGGAVFFGPIDCFGDNTDRFVFGVEVDQHFREAGWKLVAKNGATGRAVAFLMPDQHQEIDPRTGLPIWPGDAPPFEMNWVNDNAGDVLQGYNSNKTAPPVISFPWELGSPTWLPEGDDGPATWAKIIGALGGTVTTGDDPAWTYTGIFPVGDYGTFANERTYSQNGFFMVASNQRGAGKTWESRVLNGMKLRVHLGVGGLTGNYDGNLGVIITVLYGSGGSWSPIGSPVVTTMMAQPDYLFALDPYSFYLASRKSEFHADLYLQTTLLATMINSDPAIPPHSSVESIPTTAMVSVFGPLVNASGNWYVGPPTNTLFDGTGCSIQNESGWMVEVLRMGPAPLLNKDGSDVMLPASMCFSIDTTGPGGTAGPMYYMGQMWNCFLMQRLHTTDTLGDYDLEMTGATGICRTFGYGATQEGGSAFTTAMVGGTITINGASYVVAAVTPPSGMTLASPAPIQTSVPWSFGVDNSELILPVRYKAVFGQLGSEPFTFQFNGTQGQVFLGTANYDYFNATWNGPPADPDNVPISIKVTYEWNLFAKPHTTNVSYVSFKTAGGRPVNPDHSDNNAHYVPPSYTWTVPPPLLDWDVDISGDTMTMSGISSMDMIGIHPVTITVRDTFGTTRSIIYYLVIGSPSYPSMSSSSLPDGGVGISYIAPISTLGGSGQLSGWALQSGSLPPGLSLAIDTTGLISGVPTLSGVFSFTVIASDDITGEVVVPQTFTITIS